MSDYPMNWNAVLAEVRLGVLSKPEICRRYNISRQALDAAILREGVTDDLKPIFDVAMSRAAESSLLTDEQIVSDAAARSMAVVRSHLTLTRGLHSRLMELVKGYDLLMTSAMTTDEDGIEQVDPKKWLQAAAFLDGISKIAERITKMEGATFGTTQLQAILMDREGNSKVLSITHTDPGDAAREYKRLMGE